jgi:hypothetical protein
MTLRPQHRHKQCPQRPLVSVPGKVSTRPCSGAAYAADCKGCSPSSASITEEEDNFVADTDNWQANAAMMEIDDDLACTIQIASNPPPCIPLTEANAAPTSTNQEEYPLSTNEVSVMHLGTPGWHLDSGATMTCTPMEEELTKVLTITPIPICGVGGARIFATKVGQLSLTLADGSTFTIPDVLVIPNASIRLISIGRLADLGFTTSFNNAQSAIISQGKKVVASASRTGRGLYSIDLLQPPTALYSISEQYANAAVGLDVWHSCLGHPSNVIVEELAWSPHV